MYLAHEPDQIKRRFVVVDGRLVHYRRAGSGPPLVMLHQSPTSSAEIADKILKMAQRFTVFAPDTPGYGASDPLPGTDLEMADFAAALAGFYDTVGLARAGLYGMHTGAMIAAEFARLYPQRVTIAALDGYVVLTDAERAAFLSDYFVRMPPQADGSHMTWCWSRIRDQLIFFPWHRKAADARMALDVPPATALQNNVLDLLRAHDLGTPAYRAAFQYPGAERIKDAVAPTWLLNFPADVISAHPERLATWPDCVRREMLADPAAVLARVADLVSDFAGDTAAPPPVPQPKACRILGNCETPVALHAAGQGRPVLVIPAPGQSARQYEALLSQPPDGVEIIVADLPGHGASPAPEALTVQSVLSTLMQAVDSIGRPSTLLGVGASGPLAAALVDGLAESGGAPALLWLDPVAQMAPHLKWPDLTPEDHGGHLLAAWQAARDMGVFRPWHRPIRAAGRPGPLDVEPAVVHQRALDLLIAAKVLASYRAMLLPLSPHGVCEAPARVIIAVTAGSGAEADAAAVGAASATSVQHWPAQQRHWPIADCSHRF